MLRLTIAISSIALLALSGCAKDDTLRTEGLTLGAGDAIATNSALQIIDPWPAGVEDTDLLIPNDDGSSTSAPASGSAGAVAPQSTTSGTP